MTYSCTRNPRHPRLAGPNARPRVPPSQTLTYDAPCLRGRSFAPTLVFLLPGLLGPFCLRPSLHHSAPCRPPTYRPCVPEYSTLDLALRGCTPTAALAPCNALRRQVCVRPPSPLRLLFVQPRSFAVCPAHFIRVSAHQQAPALQFSIVINPGQCAACPLGQRQQRKGHVSTGTGGQRLGLGNGCCCTHAGHHCSAGFRGKQVA